MIYNDGLLTYERYPSDKQWRLKGTRQVKRIDIDWNTQTRFFFIRL